MNYSENLKKLLEADRAYYSTGHPIISDQEYDALKDCLLKIEPNHPIFDKVGDTPASAWKKAEHEIHMGSQNKVNSVEDFKKWASKFSFNTLFTMQEKLDGLSVSLLYDNGEFNQAVTRGDGSIGEDITPNVLKMGGLVTTDTWNLKKIDSPMFHGSVRAEIILPKKDFERINSILPKEDQYSNPRNAASGISRRLDGKYCKYLILVAYDLVDPSKEPLNEDKKIKYLQDLGFNTPSQVIGCEEDIVKAFNDIKSKRGSFRYDIDGMVIKACSAELQSSLGISNNRPKAQIAWKFDPPGAITELLSVSWDVGRTGVVTPLGHVLPVEIDGSIIRNVTLHNIAEIKRLGIGLHDTVMLVKAGDIIPKITAVIEHKNNPILIPTTCPVCGSALVNDGIKLICQSDSCPRKTFNRILNWIKVTKIDEFGESLAEALVLAGKLSSIYDIYQLQESDISSIEGWGGKSASKIIENIKGTRFMSAELFLSAVGIPGISGKTSEELIAEFKSIDGVLGAGVERIKQLKGFSDVSANSVVSGISKFKDEMNKLLTVVSLAAITGGEGKLNGLSFCFTGAMLKSRTFYQDLVKKHGGKNNSSVTKDLSYLVCNENAGSSKSVKAEKFGVRVVTEQQFLSLVGEDLAKNSSEAKIENISLFQ